MVALRMLVLQVLKKMMMLFVYLRLVCVGELFIQKSNLTSFYNGRRDGMASNVLS
jgi:hypothetical protein